MPFPAKEKITCYCFNCGKPYKVKPWQKKKTRFCKDKCKYAYIRKRMLYHHSLKRKIRVGLFCQNMFCNKKFYVILSRGKIRKFCSRDCYAISKTLEYKAELQRKEEIYVQQTHIKNILLLNR